MSRGSHLIKYRGKILIHVVLCCRPNKYHTILNSQYCTGMQTFHHVGHAERAALDIFSSSSRKKKNTTLLFSSTRRRHTQHNPQNTTNVNCCRHPRLAVSGVSDILMRDCEIYPEIPGKNETKKTKTTDQVPPPLSGIPPAGAFQQENNDLLPGGEQSRYR